MDAGRAGQTYPPSIERVQHIRSDEVASSKPFGERTHIRAVLKDRDFFFC